MKRIFSLLLVVMLLVSALPVAYATNDYTAGTQVEYTAANNEAYTITVPASLQPGDEGTVTLQGTWASDRKVTVTADATVTLTNSINAADQKTLDVTFATMEYAGDNTQARTYTEAVSVADMPASALFGTWSGKFNYNVETKAISTVSGTVRAWNKNSVPVVKLYSNGIEKYTAQMGEASSSNSQYSYQYTWAFTFNGVEIGTYDLVVTKDGHLEYTINDIQITNQPLDLNSHSSATFNILTMLCGDINNDDIINNSDLEVLQHEDTYDKQTTEAATPVADLDGNGWVNFNDLSIILFGQHKDKTVADCTFVYTT